MLGADVVVAEAQGLAEGQLQRLLGVGAVGDQFGDLVGCGWQRGGRRLADLVQCDALCGDRVRGQALRLGEQPQDQVLRPAFRVAGGDGLVVGGHDDVPRARGVAAEPLAGIQVRGLLGHEPLLRRLPGDAHALADVRPGRARAACLVHEVADQVVRHVAEVLRGDDRVLELVEGLRVNLLDGRDEVVETYG
ncbi:hypothetical protein SGLAM104S_06525 [Streptomyces glaucescens]